LPGAARLNSRTPAVFCNLLTSASLETSIITASGQRLEKRLFLRRFALAGKGDGKKGTGTICAKHPSGRSGKLDQSPFPFALTVGGRFPDSPMLFNRRPLGRPFFRPISRYRIAARTWVRYRSEQDTHIKPRPLVAPRLVGQVCNLSRQALHRLQTCPTRTQPRSYDTD